MQQKAGVDGVFVRNSECWKSSYIVDMQNMCYQNRIEDFYLTLITAMLQICTASLEIKWMGILYSGAFC